MTSHRSHSKSILAKTIHVGASTLISRIFGLAREILLLRFLGMGFIADAFDTAFMLPNSLRKIFAEGALTSAFVPSFIQSFKTEGKSSANALTTLSFIVFESLLLVICAIVMCFPYATIHMIAPGYSPAKIEATIPLLQILMPFIFFISSSALLSGALNAIHHFFIPAFAPVILNCAFLVGILGCLYYDYSITFLCWAIMAGGFLQCVMHFIAYFYYGFSFRKYDAHTISTFKSMLTKFLFCFLSSSVMEIGLFVDQGFASYLPDGTVNLIKKSHRLMGIPLGIFAVAFSTILLPYFTKTKIDNPEKIEFYLNESLKLVLWVTLPATIIMIFFSEEIFLTLFAYFSSKFSIDRLPEAGMILSAFLSGLLFFSLNKILTTLFFALHNTKVPTIVTSLGTLVNICANYLLVHTWGATGLAAATSIGGMFQTILFIYFLHAQYAYRINYKVLLNLSIRYCIVMSGTLTALYYLYKKCFVTIQTLHIPFFIIGPGFWLWVGPLILVAYGVFYMTRRWIGSEIYFLE
jgi:putative peptidoglycan lipid II flippase